MKENADVKFTVVNDTDEQFEANEEDRQFAVQERAAAVKERLMERMGEIEGANAFVQRELVKIQREWPALFGLKPPSHFYVHVDLDSYYASVETLLNPKFKDVPLAVGSTNMIAACNYKAREFNVRAGMPGYHAKRLCPHLIITPTRMEKYNYYSELVMNILSCYDNDIEIYGIDEPCLVFTADKLKKAYDFYNTDPENGRFSLQSNTQENTDLKVSQTVVDDLGELIYTGFTIEAVFNLVDKIRSIVFRNIKLTVSAGISICRGFAKFASNVNKPNGQMEITSDFDSHIINLPVDKINGIGKMTKLLLAKAFKIFTVQELRDHHPQCALVFLYKTFTHLLRLSLGLSVFDSEHARGKLDARMKSIGNSSTIRPTTDYIDAIQAFWALSMMVWRRMEKGSYYGLIVTITIKYSTFKQNTRQKKLQRPVKSHNELFDHSLDLFRENIVTDEKTNFKILNESIRLLGVSVSNLIKTNSFNTIEEFCAKEKEIEPRECIICGEQFLHERPIVYQTHVNRCLDKQENKTKEEKKTLKGFLRRKK